MYTSTCTPVPTFYSARHSTNIFLAPLCASVARDKNTCTVSVYLHLHQHVYVRMSVCVCVCTRMDVCTCVCVWCLTHLWQVWWYEVVAAGDQGIPPCHSSCLHVPVLSDPSDPSAALDRHQSVFPATGPSDCSGRAVGMTPGPADVPRALGVDLGEGQACCAHQQLTCPVVTKCLCVN